MCLNERNHTRPERPAAKEEELLPRRKSLIVARAAEVGTHTVADAYDIDWHSIASWKKYNAKHVDFKVKPAVIIQSPDGREITVDKIRAKIGTVEKIYVRHDEGKAYWVRGKETGSVELW